VPEYDAFGREIGEDPLKAFRGPAPAPAPPRPEPVVAAPEAVVLTPEPETAVVPRVPRRRPPLRAARWIVSLVALGIGLAAVGNVGVQVGGGVKDIVDEFPSEVAPPASNVTGITGESMIRQANFETAMTALARSHLGKPLTMRVAPDRIDATLVRGNRLHQVRVTPGGELNELANGAAAASTRTIPYKAIDVTAPERLVRAGATQKVPASRIDYLVITAGPPPNWAAYYKGGRIVIGDQHGHKLRVL
jgi:hypothetical protein